MREIDKNRRKEREEKEIEYWELVLDNLVQALENSEHFRKVEFAKALVRVTVRFSRKLSAFERRGNDLLLELIAELEKEKENERRNQSGRT